MIKIVRNILRNILVTSEQGHAFILVLIMLLLGSLIIGPLLGFMGTGIKTTGEVYEKKAKESYAADAGVEDAIWHIKYDHLDDLSNNGDPYDIFDYETAWTYGLTEQVNKKDVDVTIRNVWIPKNIDVPDETQARKIIEDGKLIVTGRVLDDPICQNSTCQTTYQINVTYYKEAGEDLRIETLGVWLPGGFTYVPGSSNLEENPYNFTPVVEPHAGGQAIIWNCGTYPFVGSIGPPPQAPFPGVNPASIPITSTITFQFEHKPGSNLDAVSWITTSGVADIPFAWDGDTKIYQINSVAGDTEIEAYAAKSELRKLRSATSGNYFATGNSLIGGNYRPPHNYHFELYNSTSASIDTSSDAISGIPASATIEAVYLYWTGWMDWKDYNPVPAPIFYDNCSSFTAPPVNWTPGSNWSISSGRFGVMNGSTIAARTLTMTDSIDLSEYSSETVTISWDQSTSGWFWSTSDRFYFAFSGDGGENWSSNNEAFRGSNPSSPFSYTIPAQYLTDNFKMRFYFDSGSSWFSKYVYLDNITIAGEEPASLKYPDNPTAENLRILVEEAARVNKALFNDTPVTADAYQTLYPDQFEEVGIYEGTWFYTAMADVTGLLHDWIDDPYIDIGPNGQGDYTFGHYYVGTDPEADNYRGNRWDASYSFDFEGGGFTGYPLGTPAPDPPFSHSGDNIRFTAAHAGWSMIIIYSSPETLGHQLYLYDIQHPDFDFFFGWHNNADFNNSGSPGGSVTGFLVPEQIAGETLAGRITVMVGEGDAGYPGCWFIVNDVPLDDGTGYPANNVWNGTSRGLTVPGMDIDHFDITWASGILETGDTSVHIDIPTGTDGFTMSYMILSFRSETRTGGTITYLIR